MVNWAGRVTCSVDLIHNASADELKSMTHRRTAGRLILMLVAGMATDLFNERAANAISAGPASEADKVKRKDKRFRTMALLSLTKQDDGRVVTVVKGSEILLSLAENPTTGFRWQVDGFNTQILKSGDSTFEAESRSVGSGGKRLFHFKATAEGETKLCAKLWRQWEGENSVTERFEVTVKVVSRAE